MADCTFPDCHGDDQLAYTCNECGERYCSKHRLPEAHDCGALARTSIDFDGERFATGLQDKPGKKRGMTTTDDTRRSTPPSSSSRSPAESDCASSEASKPYDTGRGWRSRSSHDRASNPDTASESSLTKQTTNTSTVSTASTRPANEPQTRRLRESASALWAGLTNRLNALARWLWYYAIGFLRLTGAVVTILGVGWLLGELLPLATAGVPPNAAGIDIRSVLLLAVGIVLVVTTKE